MFSDKVKRKSEHFLKGDRVKKIFIIFLLLLGSNICIAESHQGGEDWFKKGKEFFAAKNYHAAIGAFTHTIKLDPKHAKAYNNRGAAYHNLGHYEQALTDYDKAIVLNPKNAKFYHNRGAAHYNLYRFEQAIKDFDKAIDLDPEDAGIYVDRGIAYDRISQYDMALANMKRAARLGNQQAKNYLNRHGIVAPAREGKRSLGINAFTKKKRTN